MNKGDKLTKPRAPGYQKERGDRQMARILDTLTDGPRSAFDLMAQLHMSRKMVYEYLARLMEKGNRRVHVCGFELNGGRPRTVYDIGDKPNLGINTYQKRRMVEALLDLGEPSSTAQVAKKVGMTYGSAKAYMRDLYRVKRVHIADYEWVGKTQQALFMAGKGEDAPWPTKRTESARPRMPRRASVFSSLGL